MIRKNSFFELTLLWLCTGGVCLGDQLGANVHADQNPSLLQTSLSSSSFSLRVDFHWSDIELQKGSLVFPARDEKFDALLDGVANTGNAIIVTLDYGNQFYGGGPTGVELPKTTEAMKAFANYASFIVTHFKGRVTQFEVYNEWNLDFESLQVPHVGGDAATYVNLLRVVYPAIKAANPLAVVVGGAVGGTDSKWLGQFIQAGGLDYVDVVSVHPYVYRHALVPTSPSGFKLSLIQTAGAADSAPIAGTPEEAVAWLDQVHLLVGSGAPSRSIPIYVTEIGWPTNTNAYGVSDSVAAAYLQRFLLLTHSRPWIGGVWWYDLIDDGNDPGDAEARFGLMRQDGSAKPLYDSLMQIKNFINAKSTALAADNADGTSTVMGESSDNKKYCAIWLPTNDFVPQRSSATLDSLLKSGYHRIVSSAATTVGATPLLLEQ